MSDIAYTAHDAAAACGVGRTTIYALIAEGHIAARKCRSRTLIPADSLRAYIASLPPADIRMPATRSRKPAA